MVTQERRASRARDAQMIGADDNPPPPPAPQTPKGVNWGRAWERWYPLVFALLVGGTVAVLLLKIADAQAILPQSLQQPFASTVDVGAIAAGFLGTALTVVLGLQGTAGGKFLRDSGLHDDL